MEELILFIMCFVLVYIIYQLFVIIPAKKRRNKGSKKGNDKEVFEVKYLESVYKLDLKKIKYEQLLQICALVTSLDISIGVFFVCLAKNFWTEMLFGFVSVMISILITYHLVYLFYKKKGMIKNGKHK